MRGTSICETVVNEFERCVLKSVIPPGRNNIADIKTKKLISFTMDKHSNMEYLISYETYISMVIKNIIFKVAISDYSGCNKKIMKYIVKRLLQLILILLAITFVSFAMMRLAGSDAVEQKMLNTGGAVSEEAAQKAREELGLDKPFITQYVVWLGNVLHGDMGSSYVSGKDVFQTFLTKLPATLLLTAVSLLLTIAISVPLGIVCAVFRGKWIDILIRVMSFIGNSMPNFFVSLVLMYLFAIVIPVFPVISRDLSLKSVALPAITLAIAMSAKYLRQIRAAVLEELNKPYVLGERARGIRFRVTLFGSVFRSCLVTILTLLALSLGNLLGGTAIVESIFMWDGVGKMAVDAISMRDYPIIQAYVMWMAIIYVIVNLLTDFSYRLLDPRIRLEEERG